MSRRFLLLWYIALSILIVGTSFAQDRSAMWNAAKRSKYGIDATSAARPIQTGGAATMNPLSPPNTPDVAVFAPSANAQSENSIGVNFSTPSQLMVSTNGRIPGSNPTVHQTWAFSTDAGATWPASMQSEDNPAPIIDDFGDPVAFFDRSGRAYYCTLGSPGGIYFVSTTNFGATWSARTNADPLNSSNDDKQHAAADYSGTFPNNVYTAWTDFSVTGNPVQFTRSTDQGLTWSARTTLAIGSNRGQGTHIAIGPNGEVYVFWAHYTSGTAEVGIGMAKSTDGGATFTTPTVAFPISGIRTSNGGVAEFNNVRVNSFPSADVDRSNGARRGWVYAVVSDRTSGNSDVVLFRSSNGGTTWSAPITVADQPAGKQQWFGSIAVDPATGGISVSYFDMDSTGTNFMTNRYMAYSADGGDTWDRFVISDVRANYQPQGTPNTNANYNGDYYETAAMGGKAWACWTDRRSGTNKAYVGLVQYAENFGWIRGTVTNLVGGAAVSGAAIDFVQGVQQQGATTNGTGFYLAGAQVDTPGTTANLTLRARKFGFIDTTLAVTITRNDTLNRSFAMRPAPGGTLSVLAHTATTNMRAYVEVKFGSQVVVSDSTNGTTGLLIGPLPVGTYSVRVDPPSPYGTRTFPSVIITDGATTNVDALLRSVVEYAPSAMRDTLPVGGSRAKILVLTNTTSDSVRFRITDDNALRAFQKRVVVPEPAFQLPAIERPKGAQDPVVGDSPNGRGGPDAFGYQWIDSDEPGGPIFNWVDISNRDTVPGTWSTSGDDGFKTLTLPWAFTLYGNSYTSINVVTNGFLNFGTTSTAFSNGAIPSAAAPNNAIYPFWDDLDLRFAFANVYYYSDVANGRFIIQWNKAMRFGTTTDTLTFQVQLKPNGEVLFQYLTMLGTLSSATIGVENAAGTVALQVANSAAYIHNNLAVRIFLPDAPWLSETPTVGTIAPNGNQNIQVTFDATGQTPGSLLSGKLLLDATHPDLSSPFNIVASLQVNAAVNALLVLNKTSVTFPGTVIGNIRRDTISARNQGGTTLNISSITSTNARFTVTPASASLVPGDSAKIIVTYTPIVPAGADTGRVIILSNSDGTPRKDVTLAGTAIGAPIFLARVDSLTKTVAARGLDSTRFYVRNTGTLAANFAARAVMYPRTAVTGPVQPIIVPMTVSQDVPINYPNDPVPPSVGFASSVGSNAKFMGGQAGVAAKLPSELSRVLAQNAYGYDYRGLNWTSFDVAMPGTLTPLGSFASADAIYAGDFTLDGLRFLAIKGATQQLVEVNVTNGSYTVIGPVTIDAGHTWTSMKFDPTSGTLFAVSTNITVSSLYTINPTSGTTTRVATITNMPAIIGMAIQAGTGQMYGYDIVNDNFFSVNKTTGAGTLIGAIGFNANLAQDMAFDRQSGILYMAAYNATLVPPGGELRTVNLATGATTLIGTLGVGDHLIDAFSIKGSSGAAASAWLSVAPASGTMAINDSTQFTATFDARGADIVSNPGTYLGRIEVYATNSALADTLKLPVRLTVTPIVGAALLVNPDSAVFVNVPIGVTDSSKSVLVKNIGNAPLVVTNITSSNPVFTVNRTSFTLNTNDTARVKISFAAPTPAGLRTGTLTFTSNDAAAPTVRLRGTSIGQAAIVVRPDTFTFSRAAGPDTTRSTFFVRNTGTDTLRYTINEASSANTEASIIRSTTQQPQPNVAKGAMDPTPGQPASAFGRGGPDAYGYTWIDGDEPGGPQYNWVEISAIGTQITTWSGSADDGYAAVTLPWSFPFYENSFTSINVVTNGFLNFGTSSTAYSNAAIPSTAVPNNAIYSFWDDMDLTTSGTVHYYNDAANSRFIVQYTNVPHFGTTTPGVYTFQVILTSSGNIICQYMDMQGTLNSATIGIENSGGTIGLQTVFNAAYVHNNLAILFTKDLLPWSSTNRTSGTVAPADSQSVELRIHPAGLAGGVYTGRYAVNGNTPSTAHVGVRLTVTGGDTIPRVTVTAPNGGETWRKGSTYAINWTHNLLDTVKIEYSTTGNAGPWTVISAGVPARPASVLIPKLNARPEIGSPANAPLGTFNWPVPINITASTNCYIRISKKSNASINDVSNAAFTIADAQTTGAWTLQTSGVTTDLISVKAINDSVAWIAGNAGVVLRTTNTGTTWQSVTGAPIGTQDIYNITAVDANTALVTTSSASATFIYRTTNAGTSWAQVYTLAPGFINAMHMFSAANGIAYGDPVGGKWTILKTTDGGATWARIATEPTQVGTEAGWNNSMTVFGTTHIWFGTNAERIYRSTDGGTTWAGIATVFGTGLGNGSFAEHFNKITGSGIHGIAGSATGALNRATDAGASWATVASTIPATIFGMSGNPNTDEYWLTQQTSVTAGAVYYSSNAGTSWATASPEGYVSTTGMFHIDMVTRGTGLFGWATGVGGKIVRYRRIPTDVTTETAAIPTVFGLEQNYPNPFNPSTTIRFSLPEQATVSLKVYNLLGQEIATLAQGDMQAAFHNVVWNARNNSGAQVASGMYFYRIDATGVSGERFTSLKKLIFLK